MTEPPADLAAMRRDYPVRVAGGLTEDTLASTWLEQFRRWFADAVAAAEIAEPNAMVVATSSADGQPSVRTVLLKGVDEYGFVFFTNYESRKATELTENPAVALLFGWHPMGRQVVVDGRAYRVDRAETEAYFASRPRLSQLGAWASPQSRVVASRADLDLRLAEAQKQFPADVPPPPNWGGIRVEPDRVEFWQGRPNRLHDRMRFRRDSEADRNDGKQERWIVERLGP